MFNHVDLDLETLERETIDGVRYYKIPNEEELIKWYVNTGQSSKSGVGKNEIINRFETNPALKDKSIPMAGAKFLTRKSKEVVKPAVENNNVKNEPRIIVDKHTSNNMSGRNLSKLMKLLN